MRLLLSVAVLLSASLGLLGCSPCPSVKGLAITACSGACVDIQSDAQNCGGCGFACGADSACVQGECVATCTAPGDVVCGATCVNVRTDNANCGTCGIACGAGSSCVAGQCQLSCPAPLQSCDGTCVDVRSDVANCGACAHACDTGDLCTGGVCHPPCQPGQVFCGAACIDPQSDDTFCGATADCQGAAAGQSCGPLAACTGGACYVTCSESDGGCGSHAACTTNADCGANEVCGAQGCTFAFAARYTVQAQLTVAGTEPNGTPWDNDGSPPDPSGQLVLSENDAAVAGLPTFSDSYQASWSQPGLDFTQVAHYTGGGGLSLNFTDQDTFGGDGICDLALPGTVLQALHQGTVSTQGGSCTALSVTFVPQ